MYEDFGGIYGLKVKEPGTIADDVLGCVLKSMAVRDESSAHHSEDN
jgi:hypothetical protein